jgi:hypothetical protein
MVEYWNWCYITKKEEWLKTCSLFALTTSWKGMSSELDIFVEPLLIVVKSHPVTK